MRLSTLTTLAALMVCAGPATAQTPRRIIDAHAHVTLRNFPAVLAAFRHHGVVLAVASGRRREDIPELARLADAAAFSQAPSSAGPSAGGTWPRATRKGSVSRKCVA